MARFAIRRDTGPYLARPRGHSSFGGPWPRSAKAISGLWPTRKVDWPLGAPAAKRQSPPRSSVPHRRVLAPRRSSVPPPPIVSPAPIISTPAANRQSRADRQYPRRRESVPRHASVPRPAGDPFVDLDRAVRPPTDSDTRAGGCPERPRLRRWRRGRRRLPTGAHTADKSLWRGHPHISRNFDIFMLNICPVFAPKCLTLGILFSKLYL